MLRILVANKAGRRGFDHDRGPLELGRGPLREAPRLAIDDPAVSNNQFAVEEVDGGKVRLENLSTRVDARLADGSALAVGGRAGLRLARADHGRLDADRDRGGQGR